MRTFNDCQVHLSSRSADAVHEGVTCEREGVGERVIDRKTGKRHKKHADSQTGQEIKDGVR